MRKRDENHGALPARTPRDCQGTEQWQNQISYTGQESAQAPLGPLWGSVTIIGEHQTRRRRHEYHIYSHIHLFRRHEYRYSIFFSPPAKYDIIFNLGPPCEYVDTHSTRRVVSITPGNDLSYEYGGYPPTGLTPTHCPRSKGRKGFFRL